MIKVFIGGSRKISRLNEEVQKRLDQIVEKRIPVLIGDANGVDKAAQLYFQERRYDLVEVFCMEGVCRNNIGAWPVRSILAPTNNKDFSYYSTKDKAMVDEASIGLMIWNGKSIGTLTNVFRLINQNKKVVIYTTPLKQFSNLRCVADWKLFLAPYGNDLVQKIERGAIANQHGSRSIQSTLFSGYK